MAYSTSDRYIVMRAENQSQSQAKEGRTSAFVVAGFEVLAGVGVFLIGAWLASQQLISPSSNTGGLGTIFTLASALLAVYGAALAVSGFGLMKGARWGRRWSNRLTVIGVVLLSAVAVLFLRPGPPYFAEFTVPLFAILLGALGLWYSRR
jgi:hypothetical protein